MGGATPATVDSCLRVADFHDVIVRYLAYMIVYYKAKIDFDIKWI